MTETTDFPVAIVDRIESGIAVLEAIEPKISFELPVRLLPEGVHEGAAVELGFKLRPDIEKERRSRIRDMQQRLMEKPDNS
ncbi:MAG: DUF3006 domain-containing protein [bacterium]